MSPFVLIILGAFAAVTAVVFIVCALMDKKENENKQD